VAIRKIADSVVLRGSALDLPDNPSAAGYTAEKIKSALVSPSRKLVEEFNKVIAGINAGLAAISETIEENKAEIIAGIESGAVVLAHAATAGRADNADEADAVTVTAHADTAGYAATAASGNSSDLIATTKFVRSVVYGD
jgi:hypothetical protein